MRMREATRQILAGALACAMPAWSQQVSIAPVRPSGSIITRPYRTPEVPAVRTVDGTHLHDLIRAGTIYLTVQDAIALALENNIDLEVSRYNPLRGEWQVERAQAGGALPGVPSAASQAGTVASGQGVAGSQAAAGINVPGSSTTRGANTNATVSQIGPVTQNLDPIIQESTTFSHITTPQSNTTVSLTTALVSNTRNQSATYQQGTLSGGLITGNFKETYLNENAVSDVLNPSVAPSISLSAQHNLLRGFGVAVNARQITIAKLNLQLNDLSFRTQLIGVVTNVVNIYYSLSASYEDLKAKRNTVTVGEQFLKNVQEQINLGAVAPPEEINAKRQLVTARQSVKDAETTLAQQELRLKTFISRNMISDPLVAAARIVPTDKIVMPEKDDLPPIADLVNQALQMRADLASDKLREKTSEVSMLGTKNGLLPTAQVVAGESHAGLAGTARTVVAGPNTFSADPYFVGGLGNALGQLLRRNFATERVGAFFVAQLGNNQAQADYAIDLLQLRQTQLNNQKNRNQVPVDIANYVVSMQQARARYDAAVKNRQLQQELYTGEQTKYRLGASTPYAVVQQQRDLVSGEAAITSALVSYSNARVSLDQALGRTLDVYNVRVQDVQGLR